MSFRNCLVSHPIALAIEPGNNTIAYNYMYKICVFQIIVGIKLVQNDPRRNSASFFLMDLSSVVAARSKCGRLVFRWSRSIEIDLSEVSTFVRSMDSGTVFSKVVRWTNNSL